MLYFFRFVALIFVYLIGGTAINVYRKGLKDNKAELLPNYEFWSGMPSHVKVYKTSTLDFLTIPTIVQ